MVQLVGASSHKSKGHRFNSWTGTIPRLWYTWRPVAEPKAGAAETGTPEGPWGEKGVGRGIFWCPIPHTPAFSFGRAEEKPQVHEHSTQHRNQCSLWSAKCGLRWWKHQTEHAGIIWESSSGAKVFSWTQQKRGSMGGWFGAVGGERGGLILRPFLAITFRDLNSQKLKTFLIRDTMRPVWLFVDLNKFWKDTYDKTAFFVSLKSPNFKCD